MTTMLLMLFSLWSAVALAATVNVSGTARVGTMTIPVPLLHEISTVSAGAYSVGRSLTNSWTSALALLIRSSDNATNYLVPQGGTNNIAAILTWAGSDSVYVTNLFDQSGHGRTLSGTNLSMLPRIVTNGVEVSKQGKTSMRIDSDDNVMVAATMALPLTHVFTVYNVAGSGQPIIAGAMAGITNGTIISGTFGGTRYQLANGTNVNIAPYSIGQWDIVRVVFDGVSTLGVDGGAVVNAAAGLNTITYLSLGSPEEGVHGTADMMLSEWVVFNAALSDADQIKLRNNVNSFYGIY